MEEIEKIAEKVGKKIEILKIVEIYSAEKFLFMILSKILISTIQRMTNYY